MPAVRWPGEQVRRSPSACCSRWVDEPVTERGLGRRRRGPRPERGERCCVGAHSSRGPSDVPSGSPAHAAVEEVAQLGVEVVLAELARARRSPRGSRAGRRGRRRSAAGGDSSRRRLGPRRPDGCAAIPTASRRRAAAAVAAPARPATRTSPRPDPPRRGDGVRPPGAWWRSGIRSAVAWPTTSSTQPSTSASAISSRCSAASCRGERGMSNSPPSISSCIFSRLLGSTPRRRSSMVSWMRSVLISMPWA